MHGFKSARTEAAFLWAMGGMAALLFVFHNSWGVVLWSTMGHQSLRGPFARSPRVIWALAICSSILCLETVLHPPATWRPEIVIASTMAVGVFAASAFMLRRMFAAGPSGAGTPESEPRC